MMRSRVEVSDIDAWRSTNRVALSLKTSGDHSRTKSKARLVLTFILLVVASATCWLFALVPASHDATRLAMGAIAIIMLLLIGIARNRFDAAAPGYVRYRDKAPLSFVPPPALDRYRLATAAMGLVPGIAALTLDTQRLPVPVVALYLFTGTLALGWLVWQLVDLMLPQGLQLSSHGLSGVRGSRAVSLAWEDLIDVASAAGRTDTKLVVTFIRGGTVVLSDTRIGSDPALIAAIVMHFRNHPRARHYLDEGHHPGFRYGDNDLHIALEKVVERIGVTPAQRGSLAARQATPSRHQSTSGEAIRSHRGWWWRWPVIAVTAYAWLGVLAVFASGSDLTDIANWVGLTFYGLNAAAGTRLLQWHRRLRALPSEDNL